MTARRVAAITAAVSTLACASVLTACGGSSKEVASVGGGARAPEGVMQAQGGARTVPARTLVTARVDQALDSADTRPGTPFTATVTAPVVASDGTVVVPAGAKVHGVVVSANAGRIPRLRVRLDSIDTVAGDVPLRADLREAQHVERTGPPQAELYSDSLMMPYDSDKYGFEVGQPSQQLGPPLYGYEIARPRIVQVPQGARIDLELRQPLVVPVRP